MITVKYLWLSAIQEGTAGILNTLAAGYMGAVWSME